MCTGKCAKCTGALLIPLGFLAIIANILLFFPNGEVWATDQITDHVWYFSGIVGGGLLMVMFTSITGAICKEVFLPALMMKAAGGGGCCANRCGMMISMLMSTVGAIGSLYCVIISALGLRDGPLCDTGNGAFEFPFVNQTEGESYLFNHTLWTQCTRPANVVLWNITLFSILLALGVVETTLCVIQVINGLFGCMCGTCMRNRQTGVA